MADWRLGGAATPGFTLLEVVLAIGLLGIVLATAMELLGVGLRSARTSGDYTDAVLLARHKLAELCLARLEPGITEGMTEGGYRWRAEIGRADSTPENLPAQLYTLRVRVGWPGRGGEKQVELVTLRAAVDEEKFFLVAAPQPGLPPPPGRRRRPALGGIQGGAAR